MHSEQRPVHGQFVPLPTGTKVLRADAFGFPEASPYPLRVSLPAPLREAPPGCSSSRRHVGAAWLRPAAPFPIQVRNSPLALYVCTHLETSERCWRGALQRGLGDATGGMRVSENPVCRKLGCRELLLAEARLVYVLCSIMRIVWGYLHRTNFCRPPARDVKTACTIRCTV